MAKNRSEEVILAQIQEWGEKRDNVRAILLTSSRATPRRIPDALSDYDAVVYVRDTAPMVGDDSWIDEFGSVMVRWPLQPGPTFSDDWITQLVLYDDGVRIDFQITSQKQIDTSELDAGYRVLVDKDGLTSALPLPTYSFYNITPPTAEAFADRLNSFWWDIVYVPKALWRGELNYAKYMLDGSIRFDNVQPVISWYIGTLHGWSVEVGIHGRWFHRYLDTPTWEHYQRTFAGADIEENWRALFETIDFFRLISNRVAKSLGYDYPSDLDGKVTHFIHEIKGLKKVAM